MALGSYCDFAEYNRSNRAFQKIINYLIIIKFNKVWQSQLIDETNRTEYEERDIWAKLSIKVNPI